MHVCMSLYKTHTKHVSIQDTYIYSRRVRYGRKPLVCSNAHVKHMLQCRCQPMSNICSNAQWNVKHMLQCTCQTSQCKHAHVYTSTTEWRYTTRLDANTHISLPTHTSVCDYAHPHAQKHASMQTRTSIWKFDPTAVTQLHSEFQQARTWEKNWSHSPKKYRQFYASIAPPVEGGLASVSAEDVDAKVLQLQAAIAQLRALRWYELHYSFIFTHSYISRSRRWMRGCCSCSRHLPCCRPCIDIHRHWT